MKNYLKSTDFPGVFLNYGWIVIHLSVGTHFKFTVSILMQYSFLMLTANVGFIWQSYDKCAYLSRKVTLNSKWTYFFSLSHLDFKQKYMKTCKQSFYCITVQNSERI